MITQKFGEFSSRFAPSKDSDGHVLAVMHDGLRLKLEEDSSGFEEAQDLAVRIQDAFTRAEEDRTEIIEFSTEEVALAVSAIDRVALVSAEADLEGLAMHELPREPSVFDLLAFDFARVAREHLSTLAQ